MRAVARVYARFTIAAAGDTLCISVVGGHAQRVTPKAMLQRRASANSAAAQGFGLPESPVVMISAGEHDGRGPHEAAADRFYLALGELAEVLDGPRCLRDCHAADGWPQQGVYYFFESGEVCADGRDRVVRVGTHALTATSRTTLWGRLRQHRGHLSGSHPGGGNHRASVFRQHVGAALIRREQLPSRFLDSWLDRHGPRPGWTAQEAQIEQAVSRHIQAMPFLWLAVPERADRGYIENNSIALTSCLAQGLDPPSGRWLGRYASRAEICQSGLWNVDHVRGHADTGFLDLLDQLVEHQHQGPSPPAAAGLLPGSRLLPGSGFEPYAKPNLR